MAISPGETAFIRAEIARVGLVHRYTWTPRTAGAPDAWNDATTTSGTPTTGLPCRYRAQETLRTDTGGRVTIDRPNLSLPHDAPLAVGDLVSDITTADGVVIEAGPLAVESITADAAFGPTLTRRAYLRAGDTR